MDSGSGMCKAGFAGEEIPSVVFSSVVGRYIDPPRMPSLRERHTFVGDEAHARRGVLHLNYPMQGGTISDLDDMEALWQHAFQQMRASPSESPVLLTEAPLRPKANREKLLQLLFERFSAPGSFVALKPVLSLLACGRSWGIVLQIGEGCCTTLAILDGHIFSRCTQRTDLAGRELTQLLAGQLGERGYSLGSPAELEIAREIKEKHCYVALDPDEETCTAASSAALLKTHQLPDGHSLLLGSERFRCPELLFRPALLGREGPGVHELVHGAIRSAEVDERRVLYGNVVLAGGSTMFPGMVERMQKELSRLAPASVGVRVVAPPERKYSVWIGGSILASMSHFRWITREEYEETGPVIAHTISCT
uniref:Actin n=1 Tax=Arcella intermedia TaxID=1963864 RepID=A0A6B2L7Z9_9EUKA